MITYKAVVNYHFKKGMEEQGIKFLENELLKKAQEYGCHGIELLQNDKEGNQFIGLALWNSLQEAKHFQEMWGTKEKELLRFCETPPTRAFYKIRAIYSEKAKKAA